MFVEFFKTEFLAITTVAIFAVIVLFSIIFFTLSRIWVRRNFRELIDRTNSWYVIFLLFFVPLFLNKWLFVGMIGFVAFTAFRELISVVGFRFSARRALFLAYLSIPVQFYLVFNGYELASYLFIPVFMLLAISMRLVITADTDGIVKSFAALYWGLMITIFNLSHIPMLLNIKIASLPEFHPEGLVIFLVFLSQINDVLQFLWGKALGKHKVSVNVSPNKTWEGFWGGLFCTAFIAYWLTPLTPFSPWQAVIAGSLIAVFGFAGDLFISAIKRDYGVKDMSNLIPGHGGVFDRIDSLTFSSVIFFYLTLGWIS